MPAISRGDGKPGGSGWCVRLGLGVWLALLGMPGCAGDAGEREFPERSTSVTVAPAPELRELSSTLAARIGRDGPGAGPLGRIAVSQDTSVFAVTEVLNPDQVNLYSPTGEHLRMLGGLGDGPGEFQNVIYMTAVGDSLFIYDNVHARETVYSFDGTYRRSSPMVPNLWRAVPLAGGYTVVNAADPAGTPLHSMLDGETVAAFPEPEGPFDMSNRSLLRRPLAAESDSTFWSAEPTRYRLERRDHMGVLITRVERDADWFPPHEQLGRILPDVRPEPRVWDLHLSPDGLLWVLLHVADDRWAEQFDPERPADFSFNGNFHAYRNSVVEVIDVERGHVVAAREFDSYFSGFTSAGHLAAYYEPEQALPYIDVLSLSLERPWGRTNLPPSR